MPTKGPELVSAREILCPRLQTTQNVHETKGKGRGYNGIESPDAGKKGERVGEILIPAHALVHSFRDGTTRVLCERFVEESCNVYWQVKTPYTYKVDER